MVDSSSITTKVWMIPLLLINFSETATISSCRKSEFSFKSPMTCSIALMVDLICSRTVCVAFSFVACSRVRFHLRIGICREAFSFSNVSTLRVSSFCVSSSLKETFLQSFFKLSSSRELILSNFLCLGSSMITS